MTGPSPATPTRVLIIDDDETDRERIRRWLPASATLFEASCGADGLRLARTEHPDCVLLDYYLPDADCIDLLERLGPEGCAVVVLTSQGSESLVAEVMKRGANDYVAKSVLTRASLERIVQTSVTTARLKKRIRAQQEEFRCFAHTAAHDLRAPLRRIDQWTTVLAQTSAACLDLEGRDSLGRIQAAVQDMNQLIRGLLDYAQMQDSPVPPRLVELAPVVRQAIVNLQRVIDERGARIRVGPLPAVHGHITALELLFQNLLGNALKFHRGQPNIDVSARLDGASWILSVKDDGIGIDKPHLERIFKPFERAVGRSAFEGSGLGLATCMRIVTALGGSIWAESEPGQGTTIRVRLPAAAEDAVRDANPAPERPAQGTLDASDLSR